LIQGLREAYLPEDADDIPGYKEYAPPYFGFIDDIDSLQKQLKADLQTLKQELYIAAGH
jgi:hypothetical protein